MRQLQNHMFNSPLETPLGCLIGIASSICLKLNFWFCLQTWYFFRVSHRHKWQILLLRAKAWNHPWFLSLTHHTSHPTTNSDDSALKIYLWNPTTCLHIHHCYAGPSHQHPSPGILEYPNWAPGSTPSLYPIWSGHLQSPGKLIVLLKLSKASRHT